MSSYPCSFVLCNSWGNTLSEWSVYYNESDQGNSASGSGTGLGSGTGSCSGSTNFTHTKGGHAYWTVTFTTNGSMGTGGTVWGTEAAVGWNVPNSPTTVTLTLNGANNALDLSDNHGNTKSFKVYQRY